MDLKGKKILLLGGTGAMGVHLSRLLQKQGAVVFVTSRKKRKSGSIVYIKGDAHDVSFLRPLLDSQHFDILVDFMIYSTSELNSRVDLLLSKVDQYIFLSSSRVYANCPGRIKETSPRLLDVIDDKDYLATDEYALSKAREEDILRKSRFTNWTIIRPYITYSENRLQLGVLEKENWLYRALHNRTIVFSEDIASKITTLTYGLDVARGIVAVIGESTAQGKTFHITVDETHTWREIFNMYVDVLERHLGHKPKVMMIEKNPRVEIPHSKWQVVYDRYFNRSFDNTQIKRYIDTTSFTPTIEGLKECLECFLAHPVFRIEGWSEHAMYDRITGEWTPLCEIPTWKQRIKYLLRRTILPVRK